MNIVSENVNARRELLLLQLACEYEAGREVRALLVGAANKFNYF